MFYFNQSSRRRINISKIKKSTLESDSNFLSFAVEFQPIFTAFLFEVYNG